MRGGGEGEGRGGGGGGAGEGTRPVPGGRWASEPLKGRGSPNQRKANVSNSRKDVACASTTAGATFLERSERKTGGMARKMEPGPRRGRSGA